MKMNKTEKRANWLKSNAPVINNLIKSSTHTNNSNNAFRCKGWVSGYGWWLNALRLAGINCPGKNYWSGSAPTPSTAIPSIVADYIRTAPDGLK